MKNLTDITIILDRSGSMESVRSDTIGGFNSFLDEQQKADGEAVLSLVQFDDQYEVVHGAADIKQASKLTDATFQPRGMTALLDAIGRTIDHTGDRFAKLDESERPDKVVMVIMTDGLENASREFDYVKIADLIKRQTNDYNWQFVFVGANQDAVLSARQIGIRMSNAMSYAANAQGVQNVMASVSKNVVSYRQAGVAASLHFTDDDRKKQQEAGLKKK